MKYIILMLLFCVSADAQTNIISGSGPDISGLYDRLPQLNSNNVFTASNSFSFMRWMTNPTNGNILVMDASGNLVSVSPSAIVSGFSGDSSQLSTASGITSVKSGAVITNLNVSGNLIIGAVTNDFTFHTIQTNWPDNVVNLNATGRNLWVSQPCTMTPSLLLGVATYALVIPTVTTNQVCTPSLLTALIPPTPGFVQGLVPPGKTFYFTNLSTAGSAAARNGGQYEVH